MDVLTSATHERPWQNNKDACSVYQLTYQWSYTIIKRKLSAIKNTTLRKSDFQISKSNLVLQENNSSDT